MEEYRTVAEQTGGEVLNLGAGIEKATAAILPSPIIDLVQTSYEGPVNSRFTFDASSSQVFVGPDLVYDWDLDGNGLYELLDAGPIVEKTFGRFEGEVFVRATDRAGHSTVAAIYVRTQGTITPLTPTKIIGSDLETSVETNDNVDARAASGRNLTTRVDFATDANQVLLVIDDSIFGFVELVDGQGHLLIEDISADSQLTLIPYSAAGRRGTSHTISLNEDEDTSPAPDTSPTPDVSSSTDVPAYSPDTSAGTISPTSPTIPKAPNTGVRGSNKKEVGMSRP